MNSGKVCVSVAASTADEMIAKIRRAEPLADVVEVRFDHMADEEIGRFRREFPNSKGQRPLIATYRSSEQGGRRSLAFDQRSAFWSKPLENFWAADVEEDMVDAAAQWPYRIVSYHGGVDTFAEIDAIYERLLASNADAVKIAANANTIDDGLAVWKLLDVAKAGKKPLIPIAMGEVGKWTRILGLAHGAFMTYAALEEGSETAAGQLTARDLLEVYRIKDIDLETKVYGVIGDPVSASLSPYIHNAAFAAAGLNAVFLPLQLRDVETFFTRMVLPASREAELNFAGFAVTMPHKQAVLKYLDTLYETAKSIGAVNTIAIEKGRSRGFNTDAHGFITPLRRALGDIRGACVAIVGAGGAARACVRALAEENANVSVFARSANKAALFGDEFGIAADAISNLRSQISNFDILVNATPIGMKGEFESFSPLTAGELKGVKLVFDLVTGAGDTPLMEEAKEAGVTTISGVEMLIEQAAKQFEVWTGGRAPLEVMRKAVFARMEEHDER